MRLLCGAAAPPALRGAWPPRRASAPPRPRPTAPGQSRPTRCEAQPRQAYPRNADARLAATATGTATYAVDGHGRRPGRRRAGTPRRDPARTRSGPRPARSSSSWARATSSAVPAARASRDASTGGASRLGVIGSLSPTSSPADEQRDEGLGAEAAQGAFRLPVRQRGRDRDLGREPAEGAGPGGEAEERGAGDGRQVQRHAACSTPASRPARRRPRSPRAAASPRRRC